MIAYIITFSAGTIFGLFVAALMVTAREADRDAE